MAYSFEQVPHEIIENKKLKGGETKTLLAIMRKCGSEKKTTISASDLAQICGTSEKTCYRHIEKFVKLNIVEKAAGRGKKMGISLSNTITDVMKKSQKERTNNRTKEEKMIDKLTKIVDKMSGQLDKMSELLDTSVLLSNVSRVNTPFNTPSTHPGGNTENAVGEFGNVTDKQIQDFADKMCEWDECDKSPERLRQATRFIKTHGLDYANAIYESTEQYSAWQKFNSIAKEYKQSGYKPTMNTPSSPKKDTQDRQGIRFIKELISETQKRRCLFDLVDVITSRLQNTDPELHKTISIEVKARADKSVENSTMKELLLKNRIPQMTLHAYEERGLVTEADYYEPTD